MQKTFLTFLAIAFSTGPLLGSDYQDPNVESTKKRCHSQVLVQPTKRTCLSPEMQMILGYEIPDSVFDDHIFKYFNSPEFYTVSMLSHSHNTLVKSHPVYIKAFQEDLSKRNNLLFYAFAVLPIDQRRLPAKSVARVQQRQEKEEGSISSWHAYAFGVLRNEQRYSFGVNGQ